MALPGNPEDCVELSPQEEIEKVNREVKLAALNLFSLWYDVDHNIEDPFSDIYDDECCSPEIVSVMPGDFGVNAIVIIEHDKRDYCLRIESTNRPSPRYPKDVVVQLHEVGNDSSEFIELDVLRNGVPKPARAIY